MSTGSPWHPWGDPHFSPKPQPNPMRVVPMTGPRFQSPRLGPSPLACVLNMSSELRVDGVVAGKKTSYSRHWNHFLSLNFLLWPNSRLRTQNQGGLWSSFKAKNQPSVTLSICKINSYTLIPHNASVPDGTPRETFVIQIGGLYYPTPPRYSLDILHADGTWTIPIPHP